MRGWNIIMKHDIDKSLFFFQRVTFIFFLRILFIFLFGSISFSAQAEDRFAPPNINVAANTFESRFTASSFNVDFLLSNVLNNARQIERLGEEAAANLKENTKFITEQVNTIDGAISNSVIVPPGSDADTIIVINMNEGDSIAIQR